MELELTRAGVLLALESEIPEVDGQWQCRICPRRFESRRAVPVHELVHRRVVGLAPPPHRGNVRGPQFITCQYDGCTDRMVRTSLSPHLMTGKHGLDRAAASFYARKRMDEERFGNGAAALVLRDEDLDEPEPPVSPMTDLAAVEAVTGILAAARSDGLIPTRMLPAIHELVTVTEEVLQELRRLTDG